MIFDTANKREKGDVFWNLNEAQLFQEAVCRKEGLVSQYGGLAVKTGLNTGRAAQDKFIVLDETTRDTVWWEKNSPLNCDHFDCLFEDVLQFSRQRDIFIQDLYACSHPHYRVKTRVITQYAWHSLFMRHLLIVPPEDALLGETFQEEFLILAFPEFKADPRRHGGRTNIMIACDFTRKIVIIVGTAYAGEMKKSVFTMLNFMLPDKGVMPMHCSVNVGLCEDSAIFFGLSGTGKTTLSADPERMLIGDDEHGWCADGLFNFEGGCYAKMIRLSRESEPEIYATSERFSTVFENVVINETTRILDFDDDSLTENTRAAYPVSYIPHACLKGQTHHPKNIILLTADAFGIMPPVARLTDYQTIYHFLSGYTARVAGTEKGLKEPEATFSACFGAPFMARHPYVYGQLLHTFIQRHKVACWLLNTGWTGGPYGVGQRISIQVTRHILHAILNGSLVSAPSLPDEVFGFLVPQHIEGLDENQAIILHPRQTWRDTEAYDAMRCKVVSLFQKNFEELCLCNDPEILKAGPVMKVS